MPNAKHWLLATRPKTLPAGIVPVLLGSSIAYSEDKLNWLVAVLALICSLLIQIITNFINEIYDFKKGADTADKLRKPSIHAGCGCPQLSKKSADKVRTKCGQTGEIPDSEI